MPSQSAGPTPQSPLRYPGSKRRLAKYIQEALTLNDLSPALYIEPFAGGASVALHLLAQDCVERVILIDRDPLVADFWKVVFTDTEWLIDQVLSVAITLENWDAFRAQPEGAPRDNALKCLFLNRTSFSGILIVQVGLEAPVTSLTSAPCSRKISAARLLKQSRPGSLSMFIEVLCIC